MEKIADALNVSPAALNVPDIKSHVGVMHTLFALEDLYAFKIDEVDGEPVIRLNKNSQEYLKMVENVSCLAETGSEVARRRDYKRGVRSVAV